MFARCRHLQVVWTDNGAALDVRACVPSRTVVLSPSLKNVSVGNVPLWTLRNLLHVEIPDGVERIGARWFAGSKVLGIHIPASVAGLEQEAFYSCQKLRVVTFAEGSRLERICERAFAKTSVVKVTIPAAVMTIERDAFRDCRSMKSVFFQQESKLKTIGTRAFLGTKITSFTAPEHLRSIGELAFCDCQRLTAVTLNENLEQLGRMCFLKTSLSKIEGLSDVVPLKELGIGYALNAVQLIPETTYDLTWRQVDKNAEVVVIPTSARDLFQNAFRDAAVKRVIFPEDSRAERIQQECFIGSALEEVWIPPSVREIGYGVFFNCRNLRSATLSTSPKEIDVIAIVRKYDPQTE